VLIPHWIEHNGEHASEFRAWAERAGPAREALVSAARMLAEANGRLELALEELGGPIEHPHDHSHA
jgi:hypothetical protein